ncbi:hypothetical protein SAMN06265784_103370 [Paraburkholderia susongensis]|uniref:Uncharacterized protein n=1 Tax=Paraburkholderia susongensis TaxID=1515439 RepID=A0A1X7K4Z2_9BURK|nr:hypothetical protein SAMN06265784_103370 [Paraburkholderia susongensis]
MAAAGADVPAGAFAAVGGGEDWGGCGDCAAAPGAAVAGALLPVLGAFAFVPLLGALFVPLLVSLLVLLPAPLLPFAPGVAEVAFSALAAVVADLAAGAVAVSVAVAAVAAAGAGAAALAAAPPPVLPALPVVAEPAANAPDGIVSAMLAQPSTHAVRRAARLTP